MPMELFSNEYKTLKAIVSKQTFDEPLKTQMAALKDVFGDDGFDESCQPTLDLMRGLLFIKEADRILQAAGGDPASTLAPYPESVQKAAAIKFLRHLYLAHQRGSQKVWVFDSPDAYRHYPSGELDAVKTSPLNLKNALGDRAERFGAKRRQQLGDATITGLGWCQKTIMALAEAKANPASDAMTKVRRWFADGSTTDAELALVIGKLAAGFKKVTATINSTQLIFTDMASLRGATSGKEADLLSAYAFVFAGRYERLPVIYIENAFFGTNTTPLPDKVLWAITVVHEITHLDVSTKDHQYDYAGLKPGPMFPSGDAAENADSWAYFCADCANALTPSNINSALTGF
jgi:hypothetical protein